VKVDKHSTGGVGDKVSICLAPLVAACGVARADGERPRPRSHRRDPRQARGHPGLLGSTSTTLTFVQQVREVGWAPRMIGQTAASRRPTSASTRCATSPPRSSRIPLIVASILSKKLAEGIDGLVLDVKVGRGAFMKTRGRRRARSPRPSCGSALRAGKQVVAVLTRMDAPLGLHDRQRQRDARGDRGAPRARVPADLVRVHPRARRRDAARGARRAGPRGSARALARRHRERRGPARPRADDRGARGRPPRRRRPFAARSGARAGGDHRRPLGGRRRDRRAGAGALGRGDGRGPNARRSGRRSRVSATRSRPATCCASSISPPDRTRRR
jgi:hypothetical protein